MTIRKAPTDCLCIREWCCLRGIASIDSLASYLTSRTNVWVSQTKSKSKVWILRPERTPNTAISDVPTHRVISLQIRYFACRKLPSANCIGVLQRHVPGSLHSLRASPHSPSQSRSYSGRQWHTRRCILGVMVTTVTQRIASYTITSRASHETYDVWANRISWTTANYDLKFGGIDPDTSVHARTKKRTKIKTCS